MLRFLGHKYVFFQMLPKLSVAGDLPYTLQPVVQPVVHPAVSVNTIGLHESNTLKSFISRLYTTGCIVYRPYALSQ